MGESPSFLTAVDTHHLASGHVDTAVDHDVIARPVRLSIALTVCADSTPGAPVIDALTAVYGTIAAMSTARIGFVLLSLMACDPPQAEATVPVTEAPTASAGDPVAEAAYPSLDQLTDPKARDALRMAGYTGGRANTGPEEGAFSLSWRGASGERAEVAVHIFETDFAREHNRPLVSLEGAHAERGDRLLVVAVQDAGEINQEASQELLAAILSRAADPAEPIAAMTLPESSWLRPRTAVVDTSLVIAPDLIETATKALEAEGYENVSMRTSQRVDTTNPNDHGHPGHEIAGTTADGAQARVGFRCVGADLDSHFWPTPQEAELGEAIAVVAHCKVVVGVRVDSNTGADLSRSKALFEAMAGFEGP